MKETIQYDACDGKKYSILPVPFKLSLLLTLKNPVAIENSWDLVDGKYPLSNACGQLGQKYDEYHCSEEEKHMECPVDPNMVSFYGKYSIPMFVLPCS
jgi:hypothetical protein